MGFVGLTNYKKNSERFPNKHHITFADNKTLVHLKIEQLQKAGAEHVYVSTDDKNVISTENITYVPRDEKYCNNITQFSSVLQEIYNTVPIDNSQDVIYTFTCCPLFSRYKEMYSKYIKNQKNQIAVHPSTHYFLDNNKRPINFNFGLWHTYSQGIDPVYMFPYAGTVCKMEDLRKVNYMIPQSYDYFELNQFEAIDIDTKQEFEMAQKLYNL